MTRSTGNKGKGSPLKWPVVVRPMTNPFVLGDMCKAFGAGVFGVYLFMIVLEWSDGHLARAFGPLTLVFSCMFLGFFAIGELILLIVYRNRYDVVITLDDKQALFEGGRVNKKLAGNISRLAILAGGMASSPGTVGAGILAASTSRSIAWKQVAKVTEHPRYLTITLSNFWRPVVRVFCPDQETYDTALTFIRERVTRS